MSSNTSTTDDKTKLPSPGPTISASCAWTENEDGCHETQCGRAFEFTWDGVKANGFKFCPFCGKPIAVLPNTELSGGDKH